VFWLLRKGLTQDEEEQMPFMPAMIVAFFLIVFFDTEIMGWLASFL
jgi:prepilin signal peptidase PulO-like enzyme (type II secretory pathway)